MGGALERARFWLIEQKARVLTLGKRFAEAVAWVNQQEHKTELLQETRVVSLIELQRLDEAAVALAEWEKQQGQGGGGTLRIGVRLARERKDIETLRSLLATMCERSPMDPNPWIYAVVQSQLVGDTAGARQTMETVFMRFETGDGVLVRLAQPLVEIGAWDLYDEVDRRALSLGQKTEKWQQLRVDAAIKRGRFEAALVLLESIKSAPDSDVRSAQALDFWRELNLA